MDIWIQILRILNTQMDVPTPYGWFHILFWILSIAATVFLCAKCRHHSADRVRSVVLATAILVTVLEIYKQINFSFQYDDSSITFQYQWYAFPWQFCSMPMYVGLLAGFTKQGKLHDACCAFLSTYAVFAGLCVMFYPVTVFTGTVGINIQTMICHGTMLPIGAYLLATGHVALSPKTVLKALPVFLTAVLMAAAANELAFYSGLLEDHEFNMFFISRHCTPSLPVYSLVQGVVPYPWCLLLYIGGFTAAALLLTLLGMGIRRLIPQRKTAEPVNV